MAKVNLILDEAGNLGPMRVMDEILTLFRGYGIRAQLYYQNLAQLKKCFPKEQDATVLANVTQVFFGVNDTTAEYISNRLGEETIVVESGGTSQGHSEQSQTRSMGQATYSSNASMNWSQMGRKLLKPEEVLAMDERNAITFVAGQRPILTRLDRYYERSAGNRTITASTAALLAFTMFVIMTNIFLESLKLL